MEDAPALSQATEASKEVAAQSTHGSGPHAVAGVPRPLCCVRQSLEIVPSMRRPLAPPGELSGGTWRPVSHTHEGVQVSPRQGLRDTLPQSPRRTDRDILTSPRQTARTKHKEQLQAEIFGSARRQSHMAPAPSNSMTQKEAAHQDSFGSPRTLRKAVQGPQSQAKMHGGAHLGSIQPWVEVQTTPR